MGVISQEDLIEKLSEKYPEFTKKSLKELVNFGTRKMVRELNKDEEIFINGKTKGGEWDGMLIFEFATYREHIAKNKLKHEKRLLRNRVQRFLNKK